MATARLVDRGVDDGIDERLDIYLIGQDHRVNAKLRGATTLDVKRLVATAGPLEQWRPDPPVELPLAHRVLERLFVDLGIERSHGGPWSDTQLADPASAIADSGGLAVTTRKRRWRCQVDGVATELVHVHFPAGERTSIAVEDDDHDAVRAVSDRLGLTGPNVAMNLAAEAHGATGNC